jgi:3-phenylpropionate/cinnamic acid dioxygenase small subunit
MALSERIDVFSTQKTKKLHDDKKINNSVVKVRLFDEKENKIYTCALKAYVKTVRFTLKKSTSFFLHARFFQKLIFDATI